MKKILIGCVTYDGQEPFLEKFLDHVKKLDTDILFVDNSITGDYSYSLKSKGLNVIRDKPKDDIRINRIISGRNKIRDYFLEKDYEYLLFIDTDVLVPENTIEELLKCNSDVSSGIYLCNQVVKGKIMLLPTIYKFKTETTAKTVLIKDIIQNQIFDIMVCGLGCTLIKKEVLEKVSFHGLGDSKTDKEDVAFCLDARKQGFTLKANTAVKCGHYTRMDGKDILLKIKET